MENKRVIQTSNRPIRTTIPSARGIRVNSQPNTQQSCPRQPPHSQARLRAATLRRRLRERLHGGRGPYPPLPRRPTTLGAAAALLRSERAGVGRGNGRLRFHGGCLHIGTTARQVSEGRGCEYGGGRVDSVSVQILSQPRGWICTVGAEWSSRPSRSERRSV